MVLDIEIRSHVEPLDISHHRLLKHRILLCRKTGVRPLWRQSKREELGRASWVSNTDCGFMVPGLSPSLDLIALSTLVLRNCYIFFSCTVKTTVVSRKLPICLRSTLNNFILLKKSCLNKMHIQTSV